MEECQWWIGSIDDWGGGGTMWSESVCDGKEKRRKREQGLVDLCFDFDFPRCILSQIITTNDTCRT